MKVLPIPVGDGSARPYARISDEDVHPHVIPEYRGNETVLLVDDEPMIRDFVTFALERYGYNVLVAKSGEEAIGLADAYMAPLHLVVADVVMPGMNGCSLCDDLRRWHPTIGVLLMSGFAAGERDAYNMKADLTFFVRKPFGMEQLIASVRAALDWRPKPTRQSGDSLPAVDGD